MAVKEPSAGGSGESGKKLGGFAQKLDLSLSFRYGNLVSVAHVFVLLNEYKTDLHFLQNFQCATISNFTMGTILEMGFAQAQVHTVHSTSACANPIPEIVPMMKLHSLLACAFIMST